jgi:hypothetical protein
MKWMASACRILASAVVLALPGAGLLGVTATPAQAEGDSSPAAVLWAAPDGHGAACAAPTPCSLTTAQAKVHTLQDGSHPSGARVELLDGTYRLGSTWTFGAQDSGTPGHPVVWEAAPGAHPVISGATRVSGWQEVGHSGVWSAHVPHLSATRQLYVDGNRGPDRGGHPGRAALLRRLVRLGHRLRPEQRPDRESLVREPEPRRAGPRRVRLPGRQRRVDGLRVRRRLDGG